MGGERYANWEASDYYEVNGQGWDAPAGPAGVPPWLVWVLVAWVAWLVVGVLSTPLGPDGPVVLTPGLRKERSYMLDVMRAYQASGRALEQLAALPPDDPFRASLAAGEQAAAVRRAAGLLARLDAPPRFGLIQRLARGVVEDRAAYADGFIAYLASPSPERKAALERLWARQVEADQALWRLLPGALRSVALEVPGQDGVVGR